MDGSFNRARWLMMAARLVSVVAVAALTATAAEDWAYGWWVVFGVVAVAVVVVWWSVRRLV